MAGALSTELRGHWGWGFDKDLGARARQVGGRWVDGGPGATVTLGQPLLPA